ncbi:hypothetical protein AB4072_03195 [Microvirga sp. 2MCAF38]|uniref:hypothetical protein n=1 Tax=Microvirga sp. 2MCAF38 TaxID=3232989 RepID=UPI003F9C02AD
MTLTPIEGFTNLTFIETTSGYLSTEIMIAHSSKANPTNHAYYPMPNREYRAGDIWFGTSIAGKDVFVFDTKPNSKTNVDIIDFTPKIDNVWLDDAVFKKLGAGSVSNPRMLSKKFFVVGENARDKNDHVIYNKKTGSLFYDADGSGAGKAVEIAKLTKGLKLTHADFFVV